MREIVTVQVGGFANFIGSHFWNFQDELLGLAGIPDSDPVLKNHCFDMDVLYRTGETHEGVLTYTPRLVSVDYQGSLGSMSSLGTLYNQNPEVPSHVATWRGSHSAHRSEPRKKNLFLQSLYEDIQKEFYGADNGYTDSQDEILDKDIVQSLENEVEFWTDYSKVHYHPQSLYEVSGLWMDIHEFNNYGIGKDVFSEGFRGEEMNERLRFFIEECDHVQGIQFVVDDSGGFSSVASDLLESIADEYTNTPVLLYSVRGPDSATSSRTHKKTVVRDLHDAISFSRLSSYCKLIVPVGLPALSGSQALRYLRVDDEKSYHCSSIYAAAMHSISIPFRMNLPGPTSDPTSISGASDINGVIQMLSGQLRQNMVAILDAALPAPSLSGKADQPPLLSSLQPLTPEVSEDAEDLLSVESLVVHGAFLSDGQQASISQVQERISAAYEQALTKPRFSHLSASLCPLPIPLPFPSIFSNVIGKRGELLGTLTQDFPLKGSLDVHSIPMAAKLRSSSAILPFLSNRLENLQRFGVCSGAPGKEVLRSWGFEKDDVEDMGERILNMVRVFDSVSDESSDSD